MKTKVAAPQRDAEDPLRRQRHLAGQPLQRIAAMVQDAGHPVGEEGHSPRDPAKA